MTNEVTPVVEQLGAGKKIGILTSGGDAQGMNATVRAVVRTAVSLGARVFAIYEGYQGMVDGGTGIRELVWEDVGSILHKGGTMIGTFRSKDFREYEGRKRSAVNLLANGIDRLIEAKQADMDSINDQPFSENWARYREEHAEQIKALRKLPYWGANALEMAKLFLMAPIASNRYQPAVR